MPGQRGSGEQPTSSEITVTEYFYGSGAVSQVVVLKIVPLQPILVETWDSTRQLWAKVDPALFTILEGFKTITFTATIAIPIPNPAIAENKNIRITYCPDPAGSGGGGGGVSPSANNYVSNETIDPIPAGLVGVTLTFGFSSIGFGIKNNSDPTIAPPIIIEYSEDAGATWQALDPGDMKVFDLKQRASIVVRDPLGVGGQSYRVDAW